VLQHGLVGLLHPRSAVLVIGVHLDEDSGAPWYATLEAYEDLTESRYVVGRVTDAGELLGAARRWLESVLAGQRHGDDKG
jgi:hypothetical protein